MTKATEREGIGDAANGVAGTLTSSCAADAGNCMKAMFTRVNRRTSATKQGGLHEGTEIW
jgi:hypothetical protein